METYSNLEKLSNDLKNLFQNQNENENEEESYFDFEIICEQNQVSFKTHKSILSSRSYYFKTLFKSKMKEYQENKMILKDVSSSILSSILNYFYSGKIEINLENAIQILIFSSKYLIDELIEISSNFIKKNLQFETIIDILKLSETMNLNQLLNSCYQFISENLDKFIKTPFFFELEENHLNFILLNDIIPINEFELFQSIIKWGKHKSNINQEKENQNIEKEEKEKFQNQISNIINKIRFIDFTKQELKDTLKEDLIPSQISEKLIQFQIFQNHKNETNFQEFIEKEFQNENSYIFKTRFKSSIIQEKDHIDKLREWINDDNFFLKMKLRYSTKKEGIDCKKWHSICDNKGKTLVVIKSKDNFIFGGFTSVGWISDESKWSRIYGNDGYISDPHAFIFSLRNDKNDRKPERFKIKQKRKDYAISYNQHFGPNFGGENPYKSYLYFNFNLQQGKSHDFCFNSNLKQGDSNFGHTYNLSNDIKYKTNEPKNYLAGSSSFEIEELETFFI
ncbi:btb/poz domain-containing protein [Anaeramoeba ignava]|uniref:Btb/poz domain-containing protein n=1 Tax=Anaeramoeba ignava TaxID=1746090 RepID=A0A9Q0L8G0_ANAIG|nr:btb/poz domain-containing protein [Anaeramoeba ignava]